MAANIPRTRRVKALTIHCPCEAATWQAFVSGDGEALERDPAVGRMLAIIRSPNALGDFGLYHGVVEISAGIESFIPSPQAKPALGEPLSRSLSPTIVLTTYVDDAVADADLAPLLDALLEAHPWEVPVMEIRSTDLLLR